MPADLLLPAFALTLALNAIFVGVAIRALRNGGREAAAVRSRGRQRENPASPPPARDRPAAEPSVAPATGVVAAVAALPPAASAAIDPARAAPAAPAQASGVPGRARPGTTRSGMGTEAPRKPSGRRRRFSLPPVEDHEKVTRSIETFLAGSDVTTTSGPPASPGPGSSSTVVTVAVVALVGRSSTLLPPDAPAWRPPADLRALLERTVRSSARATDSVAVDRTGRVRVVLPGTGELAAHAYLRRIRAVVEPLAEAADPPVRVASATATDLDGGVEAARRRAERRLAGLLQATDPATDAEPADDIEERPAPRAAGD